MHYYVNKLSQNVGLETWKWREIVTSQTAHTKYKWPPYDPEPNSPHENFLRTPLYTTKHVNTRQGRINEREAHQGKVMTAGNPKRLEQVRSSLMSHPLPAEAGCETC